MVTVHIIFKLVDALKGTLVDKLINFHPVVDHKHEMHQYLGIELVRYLLQRVCKSQLMPYVSNTK